MVVVIHDCGFTCQCCKGCAACVPQEMYVTFEGVQVSGCADCNDWNDKFKLTLVDNNMYGTCMWHSNSGTHFPCDGSYVSLELFCQSGDDLGFMGTLGGDEIYYEAAIWEDGMLKGDWRRLDVVGYEQAADCANDIGTLGDFVPSADFVLNGAECEWRGSTATFSIT